MFYFSRMIGHLAVGVSAAVFAVGCGGSDELELAPVSGKVTMDNKPLANVQVTFQPSGSDKLVTGTGSFGTTDDEGRYTLELMTTGEQGAVVGQHTVIIVTPEPEEYQIDDAKVFEDPIPARYNAETTLKFDVPAGGSEDANFDLTSK